MKWLSLSILLLFSLSPEEGTLTAAKQAYQKGDYINSIKHFRQASREFPEKAPQIRYNIAQCYAQVDSSSLAMIYYEQVVRTGANTLASQALNNMGEILAEEEKNDQARKAFINALSRDASNEKARYNFELISRRMEDENPPEEQPNPPDHDQEAEPPAPDKLMEDYQKLRDLLGMAPSQPIPGDERRNLPIDTISLRYANLLLDQMRQEKKTFVQQLTKRYRPLDLGREKQRPDW